jgi:hypothetical protein
MHANKFVMAVKTPRELSLSSETMAGTDNPDCADSTKDLSDASGPREMAAAIELSSTAMEARDHRDEDDKVSWNGPNDNDNPMNWPTWKKLVNGGLLGAFSFITPLTSSCFAPGVPMLMADFKSSNSLLATFVVSIYVLGFAFGPLLMAPLSEVYGRRPVYHACCIGFVACLIACATAPSLGPFLAYRFLSGIFGSCFLANTNGSVADMVRQEKRASAVVSIIDTDLHPGRFPLTFERLQ